MTLSLIVYDFDGTLVDTGPTVSKLLNLLREEKNQHPLSFSHFKSWLSLGGQELISNALEISNEREIEHFLKKFRELYNGLINDDSNLYSGVTETLSLLKSNNINTCICSNKPRNLIEKVAKRLDIFSFFDFIVAGDDFNFKKPNPLMLTKCLTHFDINKKQAILVGDSIIDQRTALSAQVDFCFFKSGYNDGVDLSKVKYSFDNHFEFIVNILNHE